MLLYLWMVKEGCGILRDDYFIFSARRLHASCAPLFYAVSCLKCMPAFCPAVHLSGSIVTDQ